MSRYAYPKALSLVLATYVSFGRKPTEAGLLVTVTQLGYGLGVLFVVPPGDAMDRRGLASVMHAACAAIRDGK